jgi:hypothetical protein
MSFESIVFWALTFSPRHWTQWGRSWGWTVALWLTSIVTEGVYRNISIETCLKGMHYTLSRLTTQVIELLDCSTIG